MRLDSHKLIIDDKEQTRIENVEKERIEFTFVGSQRKVPGHTLFYFNTITREIGEAHIIYSDCVDLWTGRPIHNPKVETVNGCVYMQALNKKNFIKRLRKEGYDV